MKISLGLALKVEIGPSSACPDIPIACPVPNRAAFGSDSRTGGFCPSLPLGEVQMLPDDQGSSLQARSGFCGLRLRTPTFSPRGVGRIHRRLPGWAFSQPSPYYPEFAVDLPSTEL